MACPNCDRTMHSLGPDYWWCHFCGALKSKWYEGDVDVPNCVKYIMQAARRDDVADVMLNARSLINKE